MPDNLFNHSDQRFANLVRSLTKFIRCPFEIQKYFLSAFLTSGHILLEGLPGTGKTSLAKELARTVNADFKRIQFTADLMPGDVTGNLAFDKESSEIKFVKGPIFTNILLADEINRSPPRTQSALLECMDENQITVDERTYKLEAPYFVIATQNPADLQGTFPLPENQLDRFALKLSLNYLSPEEEISLFRPFLPKTKNTEVSPAISKADVLELMEAIGKIEISQEVKLYAANLVAASREHSQTTLGGSPRATFSTLRCCQALAFFDDSSVVSPDHIRELFPYAIKHRLRLDDSGFIADSEKDKVIEEILENIEPPF